MGANLGERSEDPRPPQYENWGRLVTKIMDSDKGEESEPEGGGEPRSNPWENLKPSEGNDIVTIRGGGKSGNWLSYLIGILFLVLWVPVLRVLGIIVGLIAGAFFGVIWLRKGILRQEVKPFSRESGFYWLILSIGGAFALFLINYLAGM